MLRGLVLVLGLSAAACASAAPQEDAATAAAPPPGLDCFRNSEISGFNVLDEYHLRVRVGATRTYVFSTDWDVRSVQWEHVLSQRGNMRWICAGAPMELRIASRGGQNEPRIYHISHIERGPDR